MSLALTLPKTHQRKIQKAATAAFLGFAEMSYFLRNLVTKRTAFQLQKSRLVLTTYLFPPLALFMTWINSILRKTQWNSAKEWQTWILHGSSLFRKVWSLIA